MTVPALSLQLARHEERYVRSWQVIDQLVTFAMRDSDQLPDFPNLAHEAAEKLLTPEGRAVLDGWLAAFKRSIELMREFNAKRMAGTAFNAADWKLMDKSATTALDALEKRLRDLAAQGQ